MFLQNNKKMHDTQQQDDKTQIYLFFKFLSSEFFP